MSSAANGRRPEAAPFPLRILAPLLLVALAACTRPTGDFGRAEPSLLHDTVMPAIGATTARWVRGEPVSPFPLTDEELELRDRAWSFVRAPHVADWWFDTLAEGERTRILPLIAGPGGVRPDLGSGIPPIALPVFSAAWDPSRYHRFLMSGDFASTQSRWNRVIDDMEGDRELIAPFCAVAARVRGADIDRLRALERNAEGATKLRGDTEARIVENGQVMSWVWNAVGYRTASYRFAIDRLELEAPSARLLDANRRYRALMVEKCQGAPPLRSAPMPAERRSRLMAPHDPFYDPVPQK